jgi:Flp pilus assembly pilin Flp
MFRPAVVIGRDVPHARALVRDTRGAVSMEYAIIVGAVGLLAVGALVAAGPKVLSAYEHSRDVLAAPVP